MVRPFDFSPAIREVCGETKQAQIALVAGVSASTVSRWCSGAMNPDVNELRRMANSPHLPDWFRERCACVVERDPAPAERSSLDADGDGVVTVRDAAVLDARKQEIAARRHVHLEEEIGIGAVTPGELLEQQRLARDEEELSEREARVLEFVESGRR